MSCYRKCDSNSTETPEFIPCASVTVLAADGKVNDFHVNRWTCSLKCTAERVSNVMYLFIRLRRQKSFLWVSTIFRSSEKMTVSFSIWQRKIQICNSFCMDYRHLHENAFELINLRCLHFSTIFYSSSLYYGKLLTLHCEWKATIKLWIDFYYETRRDCESFAFIIQAFHLTFKAILHGARWRLVATFGGLRLLCYFPTSIAKAIIEEF